MDQVKEYFIKYFIDIYRKNYANFDGRARRQEYWFFVLFYFIISFLVGLLDGLIGSEIDYVVYSAGLFGTIFTLASFIPFLALAARRMHDIDKSGWWQLIQIIPVIGWIWFLILTVLQGSVGQNRFGSDPIMETPAPVTVTVE
ncbi:DUF805 domain-containing protein [Sulfurimonas marina]|uniref:DUF805 domain-containing protein n=1 Tax=Sulfurimonas marina TaxID=2590551 RepID=A0A7M3V913_9BACT|nr:DUF805 domain-containing protein [Sulfurimonas marina]QOP40246.1 DUF805 domain-containing protein [Sulfurimonas marina]